ncbi:glycoside hydrolase family 3 N-terminal domain-containing protein [Candidatus Allofournierella merdipullorum]|uniref:glycoside hydrolase family 3 protein n=1 Tax=Candidatus Allofournierella merdipullorum TaxID=2838595 RepID=UPI002A8CAE5E|nr:glycoside hydrolase family 3 N-terminal domain-containing protein [Candidatus Fournierella merdipullorum]
MLAINIQDVINVLSSVKTHLIVLGVVLVVALAVIIACKALPVAKKKLVRSSALVALGLAVIIVVNTICFGPMFTMINLAMGGGSITEESMAEAYEVNTELVSEGVTLLENNGALPLASGANVNVFGWASTAPVYGGVGSGALNDQYAVTDLITGLKNAGLNVNQDLVDFYEAYQAERPSVGMWAQDWTLPEPNVNAYTDELMASAKEFSDTALVVISRPGGENADMPTDMAAVVDGTWKERDALTGNSYFNGVYDDTLNEGNDWDAGDHYLQLSNREEEMLQMVCDNFDKVIVLINTNNAMELGFLEEYGVDAAVYTPCPGQNGFDAVGLVLAGEVNPSGKTVDTFLYDLFNTPIANNFGQFMYDNMDEYAVVSTNFSSGEEVTAMPSFVNYVEGIYVGYKFYETAAAEGLIDYDSTVVYPFGYGLSYTTFEQTMSDITVDGDTISFDVTVTNTGSVAGKNVVEVFYNPPYTNGGIEKSTANLVAFDKTDVLEPGASQTLTISFKAEDMASYDTYGEAAYVLEAGDYIISINSDSHTVLDSRVYNVPETIVYDEGRSTDLTAPTNQFENVEGDVTYLSRADHFANYAEATAAPASLSMSDEAKASFLNNSNYDPNNYNNADDVMPTTGAKNNIQLVEMRGLDYDDPQWDTFLDQLTVSEMSELIAMGGYQTAPINSIGKVQTYDCDGPASINNNFTQQGSIGFAGTVMMASTWNTDTVYKFGSSIGRMADDLDVSGWYAPAMNIHRSAFSGRNFEYYSEDGVLSGKLAAQAVQGAESHGVYSYIKHYALNDQETNRNTMLCTWANEQSIREIYLKPFELAVKEGGADAVMSSFNYIGTEWAGASNALCNTVLRDEWGFVGMVLTDYFGVYGYMDADQAIRGGTDFCLVNYPTETNYLTDTTSATGVLAARQAVKNILYTVVNSRAYAEENLNPGLPTWQLIGYGIDAVLVLVLAALEIKAVKNYKRRVSEQPVVAVAEGEGAAE